MSENELKLRIENTDLKMMVFQLQHQIAQAEKHQLEAELQRVTASAGAA